jgi:hypothetical protein
MICWIVACLLMAHKYNTEDEAYTNIQVSPTAGSDRYFPTSSPSLSPHADLELAQAALRRMSRVSPRRQRSVEGLDRPLPPHLLARVSD